MLTFCPPYSHACFQHRVSSLRSPPGWQAHQLPHFVPPAHSQFLPHLSLATYDRRKACVLFWMIFCCCCLISSEPKPLVSSGSSRSRGLGTPLLAPLILKLDFTPASEGPHSARERLGIMMNRQAWLLCCLHTSPRIHSFLTDSLGLISPPKRLRSTPIFLYFLIFCTENSLAFLADFLKYEKLLTEPCL